MINKLIKRFNNLDISNLFFVIVISHFTDLYTTIYGLKIGLVESNNYINFFIKIFGLNIAFIILSSIFIILIFFYFLYYHYIKENYSGLIWVYNLVFIIIVFNLIFTIINNIYYIFTF